MFVPAPTSGSLIKLARFVFKPPELEGKQPHKLIVVAIVAMAMVLIGVIGFSWLMSVVGFLPPMDTPCPESITFGVM